jgi:beta-glucosidase-like glycosyl hydrolase
MRIYTEDKKKKISQLIIARLDGEKINKKFSYYQSLVKLGIGGFIVFGGRLNEVKEGIKKLQRSAEIPLFIASDLEQGLGQQINGGTLFPPAMAFAKAINQKDKDALNLLRKSIKIIAQEARATGVNVILSPVLDVNTNPKNPIICTRAFSDDPKMVAWFGKEFIKGFQRQGLIACAKHFPGHGDTDKDSHLELPTVKADMKRLWNIELYPFLEAIKAGVKMVMVGHLRVPSIDSKFPSSLSPRVIQGLLREKMGFKGLVITDAMNMRAVSGGKEACLRALNAGADILLHPDNPQEIIDYLYTRWDEIGQRIEESFQRILEEKKQLSRKKKLNFRAGTNVNLNIAYKITQKSISLIKFREYVNALPKEKLTILVIDDDNNMSGKPFINILKTHYRKIKTIYIDNRSQEDIKTILNFISDRVLIAAVFSKISPWKGRSGLSRKLRVLLKKAIKASRYSVIVGFCCPYFLAELKANAVIEAYGDSEFAQSIAAHLL